MIDLVNNFLDKLSPIELHKLGITANVYNYPVKPRTGEKARFWENDLSHTGNQKNSLDFIIPDPRINPLPVYAPFGGRIIGLVQSYDQFGGQVFENFMNYVVVSPGKGEVYKIKHIGKNSCPFSEDQEVSADQEIAQTGVNGWMTDVRHVHFEVGTVLDGEYQTLKVRWSGV